MPAISPNTEKVQRSTCYDMSITLITSKSDRLVASRCDTLDSVESCISYFSLYFTTKFQLLVKIKWKYYQSKNQRNDRATRILRHQSTNFLITFACKFIIEASWLTLWIRKFVSSLNYQTYGCNNRFKRYINVFK